MLRKCKPANKCWIINHEFNTFSWKWRLNMREIIIANSIEGKVDQPTQMNTMLWPTSTELGGAFACQYCNEPMADQRAGRIQGTCCHSYVNSTAWSLLQSIHGKIRGWLWAFVPALDLQLIGIFAFVQLSLVATLKYYRASATTRLYSAHYKIILILITLLCCGITFVII